MLPLSEDDLAELTDVGFHWGKAYRITHNGREFIAWRRGYPQHVVRADTVDGLRMAIRADYFAWTADLRGEAMSV